MERVDIDTFEAEFDREIVKDDDSEAREILDSGDPIYISREDTPAGHVVRVHPNGREELVETNWEALEVLLGR